MSRSSFPATEASSAARRPRCMLAPAFAGPTIPLKKSNRKGKVCTTKKVINILLQRQDPPPGDTGLGCERRRRFYSYSTILQRDPGRLRLNQGASLQPEENKVCSPVSGDRIIRLKFAHVGILISLVSLSVPLSLSSPSRSSDSCRCHSDNISTCMDDYAEKPTLDIMFIWVRKTGELVKACATRFSNEG